MTQPSITHYRNQIRDWSDDVVKWVDDIPKKQWLQAHDEGRRWGNMTTNISECFNNVLKRVRNLSITPIVQETYYRSTELFVNRGSKAQAMMTSGKVYSDVVMDNLAKQRAISNTHQVYIHNRGHSLFSVQELVRPPSDRPTGTFMVHLDKQWCDCGKFQALHYPCSDVIAACSKIHHDFMMYVSPRYTLQYIFNTYKEEFQPIPLQSYWPEYDGIELHHNPAMWRDPKGCPQYARIHTEMDLRESSRHPKRCSICRNEGHNKKKCPHNANVSERN
ncbi:uncharacterized protein [Medicago truncatula]|uniref:uncharacterized protein n=1 Tax=Medicago truncatula TaxID=3880 RepID=UPI000D2F3B37|nr:uncharacterized protein LOC112420209 [Medicago truncatula]